MLTLKQWLLLGRIARRWSFGGRVAKYFFGLGLLLAAVQVWASPSVELNAAEREYLQAHGPVSLCIDPDWVPFETLNARGEHEGIAADLLRLAAERGGVQLQLHKTRNWEASLAASKAGACQMLSFLNQSPERDAWLIFTRPLFTDVNVLISREEHPFVVDLSAFAGSSLALPVGTSIEERVRRDYPALRIIHTDSEAQALALVSERKADLTMRSLTVAAYTIKKEGWFNLKIAGQVQGYDNLLRVGVSKDQPLLRDILDKAIATITPAELNQIVNRHVSISVVAATDYRLLLQVFVVFLVISLTSLFWVVKLRRVNRQLQVKSQTDALTGLANRDALDSRFAQFLEQARRYKRPLTVMMLDIDHFKRVNDELGHQSGDQVLREFAALLCSCARGCDFLGRWGGEEFLLLCPETSLAQAVTFAERICARSRSHVFATKRSQTLSIGVAELGPDDTMDSLIQRADAGLYEAKHLGRDRVCSA